ncbi:MAG: hypothetical protein WCW16_02965 [Candidatus Magasanikbacteria bacterium]
MSPTRKHLSFSTFFSFGLLITLCTPSLLHAEFNPNFIISDEEMQEYNSMNRVDIQAFLNDNGGYIRNLRTFDWEGQDRSVADIIYSAAQDSKINPKYILVKLQKEQSLITDPDPTQKQLDWATGYGVCDSCSMDDPTIQKYKGFGNQVDRAAGIMRWYYDHVNSESWIKRQGTTYAIDSTNITPASFATAFLYTYTPHLHGNENFWKLWQKWFDQVYPDASLIKSPDDSTIYVLQDGKRRPFKNMTALITRYDPKLVLTIPSSEVARYPEGTPISLPNYAIVKQGSNYYLLDYDYIRPFTSYDVVKKLGYNPDEIIEVTSDDIAGYSSGPSISTETKNILGRIIKLKETKDVYYIKDSTYFPIADPLVAQINFPNLPVEQGTIAELSGLTRGETLKIKEGTLYGVKGFSEIYVVEGGERRHIASEQVFTGLGYKWENIVWVNEYASDVLENGQALYLRSESQQSNTNTTPAPQQEQEPTSNPVDDMVRTPADQLSYVGPQFNTAIDAYIVSDYDTGETVAGKNINFVRPMASLAKVMTGYQLLLDGVGMNHTTTYNPSIHRATYHNFRVAEGEKFYNKDLMLAMLVSSINTPARMLVNSNENQENTFIARMNTTARSWGLEKTTFTDTSGFDTGNVTTIEEYSKLFSRAIKNNSLREYLAMASYQYDELFDVDGKPHHSDTHSNMLVGKTGLPYSIIASKTGYTYDAGTCLAMIIKRNSDGKEFVVVTMGNPDFNTYTRFDEPDRLARWAVQTL